MLSDRIKKFGLQSNTQPGSDPKTEQPDGAAVTDSTADEGGAAQDKVAGAKAVPSASNDNAAQQTAAAAAEDATEQAKQALREAFERADAERSDAAEQYVAQKLEGAIHRPASRVQPSRIKNADDRADAANGDEYSGDEDSDIPLLLRYSASLESLRGSVSGSGRTARVDSSATARKTMVAPTADPTSHIRTRLKQTMAAKHIRAITSRMSTQTPTVTESTPPDIAEPIPGKAGS